MYYVQCFKEIGPHHLVLLHDPWGQTQWDGHWSQYSSKWDDFPEVLYNITEDSSIKWTKDNPNGCFWLPFHVFLSHCSHIFLTLLFPSGKYSYYCAKGEWKDSTCGGPLVSVRDKELVQADFTTSKAQAVARPTVSIDGDHSWFCNPQFRISCLKPESIFISVVPVAATAEQAPIVSFYVLQSNKFLNQQHIWDLSCCPIVSTDTKEGCGKVKGQECSLWKFHMDPKYNYHIMPYCSKKSSTGTFVLRLFSNGPLQVESMGTYNVERIFGEWKRSNDADSAGGPPLQSHAIETDGTESSKLTLENARWGQNPQILVTLKKQQSKESVHLKFVLRKTDKSGQPTYEKCDQKISFVVCRPDFLREVNMKKKKAGAVRENALGKSIFCI